MHSCYLLQRSGTTAIHLNSLFGNEYFGITQTLQSGVQKRC